MQLERRSRGLGGKIAWSERGGCLKLEERSRGFGREIE